MDDEMKDLLCIGQKLNKIYMRHAGQTLISALQFWSMDMFISYGHIKKSK